MFCLFSTMVFVGLTCYILMTIQLFSCIVPRLYCTSTTSWGILKNVEWLPIKFHFTLYIKYNIPFTEVNHDLVMMTTYAVSFTPHYSNVKSLPWSLTQAERTCVCKTPFYFGVYAEVDFDIWWKLQRFVQKSKKGWKALSSEFGLKANNYLTGTGLLVTIGRFRLNHYSR